MKYMRMLLYRHPFETKGMTDSRVPKCPVGHCVHMTVGHCCLKRIRSSLPYPYDSSFFSRNYYVEN